MPLGGLRSLVKHAVLFGVVLALLAGCKTEEQRVANVLRLGAKLEESGEPSAAINLYRDILVRYPKNIAPRRALAAANLRINNIQAAMGQYRAILERSADDVDASLSLAEIWLGYYSPSNAAPYIAIPLEKAPNDLRTRGVKVALDWYGAEERNDQLARDVALREAQDIVATDPKIATAQWVVVSALMKQSDLSPALAAVDKALDALPKNLQLNMAKLSILNNMKDDKQAGEHLKKMYERFPGNSDIQGWTRDMYLGNGNPDEAFDFLVGLAKNRGEDPAEHAAAAAYAESHMTADKAIAALNRAADVYGTSPIGEDYRARAAEVLYKSGRQAEGIKAILALLEDGKPLAQSADHKMILARMLIGTGNREAAELVVEDVLKTTPNQTDALKLKALWQLEAQEVDDAIGTLRVALIAKPDDPNLLLMIADAYERAGSDELAGASLADAFTKSNYQSRAAVLFISYLMRKERPLVAQTALDRAVAVHPDDPKLTELAQKWGLTVTRAAEN